MSWALTVVLSDELREQLQPYRELGMVNLTKVVDAALHEALNQAQAEHEKTKRALALYEDAMRKGVVPEKYR